MPIDDETKSAGEQAQQTDQSHDRGSNLADIANAAGVSISTVSRALRGSSGVSELTKRTVRDLARDFSYNGPSKPGGVAQIHTLIPMLPFEGGASGFYSEIIRHLETAADQANVPISVTFLDDEDDGLERIKAIGMTEGRTGFLLVAIDDEATITAAADIGAVVLVNATDPHMRFDGITPANRRGAYLGTRHLLELGHRKIAHFTTLHRSTIRDRLSGYQLALSEFDIPFRPDLVFEIPNLRPNDGAQAARKALDEGALDATGIFCANDLVAVGVISAIERAGLRVPEDSSVVGFDSTRVTALHKPALTTLSVNLQEVARQSVQRLLDRLDNPDGPALDIHVGCQLVHRDSSRSISG